MRADEGVLRGLMVNGLNSDAAAHAALLRMLVPLLRSFYRQRVRGADDDIEDLVQDTLIAVHTRRATFDRDCPFTAWLFAIARYKMVDQFRRSSRLQHLDGEEDALVADDFETDVTARLASKVCSPPFRPNSPASFAPPASRA